eukprot:5237677-Pyramimonas_sp.AAC.1
MSNNLISCMLSLRKSCCSNSNFGLGQAKVVDKPAVDVLTDSAIVKSRIVSEAPSSAAVALPVELVGTTYRSASSYITAPFFSPYAASGIRMSVSMPGSKYEPRNLNTAGLSRVVTSGWFLHQRGEAVGSSLLCPLTSTTRFPVICTATREQEMSRTARRVSKNAGPCICAAGG